jgi:hypothetical protein
VVGDNIEDDGSKAKIQILQQRFGERSGPGFVGGRGHRSLTAFVRSVMWLAHCRALDTSYSADLPIIISRFPKRHMATVAGIKANETRTVYTILLWAAEEMTSPNFVRSDNNRPHSKSRFQLTAREFSPG